jgi:RNA polymerase sigma-70 factor (ECF subfamily)
MAQWPDGPMAQWLNHSMFHCFIFVNLWGICAVTSAEPRSTAGVSRGVDAMASSISDEELVSRALGGEEDAFSHLYDRYRGPVYSTACRIIQNSEEALDATQEVFIKLYRSLKSWNPRRAKFSTWLYRLACNHAIDYWRARHRRAEFQLPDSPDRPVREHTIDEAIRSPHQELGSKEEVDRIRRCAETLPELQKKIFILRYFEELKLEEIAEMENCSLGTVKTSLFRATQTMRRSLRRHRISR